MPEFMFTSNAQNANYSSTMVAEGPAVKMFDRLQQDMIEDDVELLFRVVGYAVAAGRLPAEAPAAVNIQAIAPTLAVRDRLRDAQADQILVRNGAMSAATMAMRHGLDPGRGAAVQRPGWGLRCVPSASRGACPDGSLTCVATRSRSIASELSVRSGRRHLEKQEWIEAENDVSWPSRPESGNFSGTAAIDGGLG